MKSEGTDIVETVGKAAATVAGAVGGAAAAGTIATAAGATSIPVLTTIGSWLGVTIVAATPVGWVLGCGAVGAAISYGVAKLVSNGARHRGKREILETIRKEEQDRWRREQNARNAAQSDLRRFNRLLSEACKAGIISAKEKERFRKVVLEGNLALEEAEAVLERSLSEHEQNQGGEK